MLAVATLAVPAAADAKPKPRGVTCAAASAALRPSPLRACVRVRKAPKALPSVVTKQPAVLKGKRRRTSDPAAAWMMG